VVKISDLQVFKDVDAVLDHVEGVFRMRKENRISDDEVTDQLKEAGIQIRRCFDEAFVAVMKRLETALDDLSHPVSDYQKPKVN
jgi:hypothetical protein